MSTTYTLATNRNRYTMAINKIAQFEVGKLVDLQAVLDREYNDPNEHNFFCSPVFKGEIPSQYVMIRKGPRAYLLEYVPIDKLHVVLCIFVDELFIGELIKLASTNGYVRNGE